jgi:transposase-like protein
LFAVVTGSQKLQELVQKITVTDASIGRLSANLNISAQALYDWQQVAQRFGAEYPLPLGRQAYQPTEKERAIGENAAAFGEPYNRIANSLGISEKTLHKYLRNELDNGLSGRILKSEKRFTNSRPNRKMKKVRSKASAPPPPCWQ